MNEDQLIFQAADAAAKALELLRDLWESPQTLDKGKCVALMRQSSRLDCAAIELQRRSVGVKAPPVGK